MVNLSLLVSSFQNLDFEITSHAAQEMLHDRLSIESIVNAIGHDDPRICEDYESDQRGSSCLILGWDDQTPLHVVGGGNESPGCIKQTYHILISGV